MTQIFNGKKTAICLLEKLQPSLDDLTEKYKTQPSLAIIRVGNNPSSMLYVKNKLKVFKSLGLDAKEYWFEETISKEDLSLKIHILNQAPGVHGIIIQLPLPSHLIAHEMCNQINPLKDVDGLTLQNQGLLLQNDRSGLFPCTPLGCVLILKSLFNDLASQRVLILGRSLLVGKPLALLLLHENATITIGHSKSKNLPDLIENADILVSAIGQPQRIKGSWIKKGAIILDVGITKVTSSEGSRFLGDVNFEEASQKTAFITPVPGGLGPMTVACLVYNTLKATQRLITEEPVFYDFSILSKDLFFF